MPGITIDSSKGNFAFPSYRMHTIFVQTDTIELTVTRDNRSMHGSAALGKVSRGDVERRCRALSQVFNLRENGLRCVSPVRQ